ncbi:unnamed protein product [Anisakis simplex]|uniref:Uncharacterized protein n=1 Tax=Anisakis simplex TaxID=6269 RepID=A0A3P6P0V1_ANISI|nr:unnamed protein product [Anisakis simplex]
MRRARHSAVQSMPTWSAWTTRTSWSTWKSRQTWTSWKAWKQWFVLESIICVSLLSETLEEFKLSLSRRLQNSKWKLSLCTRNDSFSMIKKSFWLKN